MSYGKGGDAPNSGKDWEWEDGNANFYLCLLDMVVESSKRHGHTPTECKQEHRRWCKNASAATDQKKRVFVKPKGFKYPFDYLTWGAKQFLRGQFFMVKKEDQITTKEAHRITGIPTALIREYRLAKHNNTDGLGVFGDRLRNVI